MERVANPRLELVKLRRNQLFSTLNQAVSLQIILFL